MPGTCSLPPHAPGITTQQFNAPKALTTQQLNNSTSIHEHLLGVCACADHVDALGQGDGRCAGGGDEGADERAGQVVDVDRSGRGQREMEVAGGSVEARGRGLDVGCGQGADVDVAGGGEVAAVGRLDVDLGLTEAADRALGNDLSRRAAAKVIPRWEIRQGGGGCAWIYPSDLSPALIQAWGDFMYSYFLCA